MENFAQYFLDEKNLVAKMEIAYYLSKKHDIFFDKSVVLKTELARVFIKYMDIDIDSNLVLTASILCNCKKDENPQELDKIKLYAKEGADYLRSLGFEQRFCKICEEVNRYSESNPRENESDILELADQFGGMLLNREDRLGLHCDEAKTMLVDRNFKDTYNRYLNSFIDFITELEEIKINDISFVEERNDTDNTNEKNTVNNISIERGSISRLAKICNDAQDVKECIRDVEYLFEPIIDKKIMQTREEIEKKFEVKNFDPNRALFTVETTRKVMEKLAEKNNEEYNED